MFFYCLAPKEQTGRGNRKKDQRKKEMRKTGRVCHLEKSQEKYHDGSKELGYHRMLMEQVRRQGKKIEILQADRQTLANIWITPVENRKGLASRLLEKTLYR